MTWNYKEYRKLDRIELNEQFYEDEVREGFYIPSAIKKAWGAEIQILNELDKVCKKLGIRYFAAWGTFLGAVRHGGYVPWDDDFDICMLRDDYNRFLDEGLKLMPEGFTIYNLETKKSHDQFLANLVSKNRICFEPEHLKKYHGFPYVTGIDIFILDYIPRDKEKYEAMKYKARHILAVSGGISDGSLKGDKLAQSLRDLKDRYGVTVSEGISDEDLRNYLDIMAEKLFASFLGEKDEAEEIVQMMPWGLKDIKVMPKYYYEKSVDIPFESGTIPVPHIYDEVLRKCYGDYMQLYKNAGAHGYPFFTKSRAQLQEVLDFDLPEYRVDADELIKAASDRKLALREGTSGGETYSDVVRECLAGMEERLSDLKDVSDDAFITDICADVQQLAMDLGVYMEAFKGEGYDIVHELEQLCEDLYELTQTGGDEAKNRVLDQFVNIKDITLRRREVLFLPFKGEYWDSMKTLYEAFSDDKDTDVYVVPIPYYYKDYKKQLINMQFDTSVYPSYIEITNYEEYDYALRHPDMIVINNPYDEWNEETSLPPFFYSDKLLKYTDRLIYIPWFKTYDFTRANEREFINMDYYCTVPGVINADTVLLQSETIRETYIDKLVEFAGEETRGLWEDKLMVGDSHEAYALLGITKVDKELSEDGSDEPEREQKRKTLLYYLNYSDLIYYGDKAVDKIGNVLETFCGNKDSLDYVILESELNENLLIKENKGLYYRIKETIDEACSRMPIKVLSEKDMDLQSLVDSCTAYYGDGGHLAHMFRNAGKPVMIQNYEI